MDLAAPALAVVEPDWTFRPSRAALPIHLHRLHHRLRHRIAAPAEQVLRAPAGAAGDWTIYFAFLPDGQLTPAHRVTLDRLAALGRRLLVVCATMTAAGVPAELAGRCDALLWKDLPGFDFSAYGAGLRLLADTVPGSDALVLNDSVFGPLVGLGPWIARARWDLTGFTATSNVENHLQSYAFLLRGVTPARMAALASVMPAGFAYDRFWAVVMNQETRFARVAARSMSVGAFCYVDTAVAEDPTLQLSLPLVRAGFPFLKRSLLGKLSHLYPADEVTAVLAAAGYPI